jgi:hypothetical protein
MNIDSNMSIGNMAQITMAMSSLVGDIALMTADNRIGFLKPGLTFILVSKLES